MRLRLTSTSMAFAAKTTLILIVLAISMTTASLLQRQGVAALSATDFKDGNIIDDATFYDKDSMTISEIQNFLNRQIPNCDTWGTSPSGYGSLTRAQYAQQIMGWHAPPYVCLNNYHENPTTNETSFEKGGGSFEGGVSAAQIIYDASQSYGISPKVLLVMLKKESAGPLTYDSWPLKSQYKYAMGYGCPDSGPNYSANCTDARAGFYKQITLAAWQLKYYKDHPNDYRYKLGWNTIQYAPDPACGTKQVFIDNIATLSLYIYTPYVPNAGSLTNYPGQAPCGAYGNRNFFMFFNEWFGSTYLKFSSLDDPRWMQIKTTTQKVHISTGEKFGTVIQPGQQAKFIDKVFVNGKWYARTQWDYTNNNIDGFLVDDLSEIQFESIPATWMVITKNTSKVDFLRDKSYELTQYRSLAKFVDKITINSKVYYRTEWEKNNSRSRGYLADDLASFQMFDFLKPRFMKTTVDTTKIDAQSKKTITTIPAGSIYYFNKLIVINGIIYAQIITDNGTAHVLDSSLLGEVADPFYPFITPRAMRTTIQTQKVEIETGQKIGAVYEQNYHESFADQVKIGNTLYARTKQDKADGKLIGFPVSELSEASPTKITKFTSSLSNNTYKIDPVLGVRHEPLISGAQATFVDKITIDGKTYYRTEWEYNQQRLRFIPSEDILTID